MIEVSIITIKEIICSCSVVILCNLPLSVTHSRHATIFNGCTPEHDEYWGDADDYSQKHVEMAAIETALALVASWLTQINKAELHDCNWLFFRVLTNFGLRYVGADHDWEQARADLDRLDTYYLTDGWYSDGTDDSLGPRDHYIAWEIHVDGLVYAEVLNEEQNTRSHSESVLAPSPANTSIGSTKLGAHFRTGVVSPIASLRHLSGEHLHSRIRGPKIFLGVLSRVSGRGTSAGGSRNRSSPTAACSPLAISIRTSRWPKSTTLPVARTGP